MEQIVDQKLYYVNILLYYVHTKVLYKIELTYYKCVRFQELQVDETILCSMKCMLHTNFIVLYRGLKWVLHKMNYDFKL